MFILFKVKGPFDVPFQRTITAKRVEKEHKREFWKTKAGKYKSGRGCYIFAVKTTRAYKAGYVGMASARFEDEAFADGKLQHYNSFLADYRKGKPVLFLIVAPQNKGKPNQRKIAAVEKHLIPLAKAVSHGLRNKAGTRVPTWGIIGVIRGRSGKIGKSAKAVRQMIGIE